jgi:hypothetical protein
LSGGSSDVVVVFIDLSRGIAGRRLGVVGAILVVRGSPAVSTQCGDPRDNFTSTKRRRRRWRRQRRDNPQRQLNDDGGDGDDGRDNTTTTTTMPGYTREQQRRCPGIPGDNTTTIPSNDNGDGDGDDDDARESRGQHADTRQSRRSTRRW